MVTATSSGNCIDADLAPSRLPGARRRRAQRRRADYAGTRRCADPLGRLMRVCPRSCPATRSSCGSITESFRRAWARRWSWHSRIARVRSRLAETLSRSDWRNRPNGGRPRLQLFGAACVRTVPGSTEARSQFLKVLARTRPARRPIARMRVGTRTLTTQRRVRRPRSDRPGEPCPSMRPSAGAAYQPCPDWHGRPRRFDAAPLSGPQTASCSTSRAGHTSTLWRASARSTLVTTTPRWSRQ